MSNVFIIAEAGVNHNGSLDRAYRLVDAAKQAGANAVKFQTFKAKSLVTKTAKMAEYQIQNTGKNQGQYEMLKSLELSYQDHHKIVDYCKDKNIEFMSTAFDNEGLDFLNELGVKRFKIPSGEVTNLPYLIKMAKFKKEVILSTGMCFLEEVKTALETLLSNGLKKEQVTILHCCSEYPTQMKNMNLKAIETIRNEFQTNVGLSDHSLGIEAAIAATALGSTVIEKHFTLDKSLPGPDHLMSLDAIELLAMTKAIRNIELALGTGLKQPTDKELQTAKLVRKSIVAAKSIKKGELFTEGNLVAKRPGEGLTPMKWFDVIGKKASKDYQENDLID